MNKINLCLIGLLALTITSCAMHKGNARVTEQSTLDKIQIGKTTKDEVRNLLGDTPNIMKQGGKETWRYGHTQANINATAFIPFASLFKPAVNVNSSMVMIRFNQNGVVEDVMSNTSGTGSSTLVPQ